MQELVLTDMQQRVVDKVVYANDKSVIVLRGFAGTGKTVTAVECANAVINDYALHMPLDKRGEPSKAFVLVLAPTAAALAVLKTKLNARLDVSDNIVFKTLSSITDVAQSYVSIAGSDKHLPLTRAGIDEFNMIMSQLSIDTSGIFTCREVRGRNSVTDYMYYETTSREYDIVDAIVDTDKINKRLQAKFKNASCMKVSDDVEFVAKPVIDIAGALQVFDLIIIDEYSMVNDVSSELILEAFDLIDDPKFYTSVDRHDSRRRLLICGDGGQLQPVDGQVNSCITRAVDNESVFELVDILRSTDKIAHIAAYIRQAQPVSRLVNSFPDNVVMSHVDNITAVYHANKQLLDNADIVLSFMNKDIRTLNKLLRAAAGRTDAVEPGDRIVCTRNAGYRPGLSPEYANGDILTITHVLSSDDVESTYIYAARLNASFSEKAELDLLMAYVKNGTVSVVRCLRRDGREITVFIDPHLSWKLSVSVKQLSKIAQRLYKQSVIDLDYIQADMAYAMTVHKAQGSEWPNVVYIVTPRDLAIQRSWHAPYTAITRAKDNVTIIYNS